MKGLLVLFGLIGWVQCVKIDVEKLNLIYVPDEYEQTVDRSENLEYLINDLDQQSYGHLYHREPQSHYSQYDAPQESGFQDYKPRPQHHYQQYQEAPQVVYKAAPVFKEKKKKEEGQDFSKIPGIPGKDYPIYHEIPKTSFSCHNVPATPGMYADQETGCQGYHVCQDTKDKGSHFLCTNGTIFSQKEFTCDWWYNVHCEEAHNYWHLNADPEHNPYFPKKKPEEEHHGKFVIQA